MLTGYDLISNSQWQAVARNIETAQSSTGFYLNWSRNRTSGDEQGNTVVWDTQTLDLVLAQSFEVVRTVKELPAFLASH